MGQAALDTPQVHEGRIFIQTLDDLAEHFKEHVAGRSFADGRAATMPP
jgi:hypothetical protein